MPLDLSEVMAVLTRTPATLRALLDGLPQPWLAAHEGEGTFGPIEVVGHLIHGEQTDWMPRVRIILDSGPARPFERFDRFGFRDAARPLGELLSEFEALRRSNLEQLAALALTPAHLELLGRHPELGPVTLGQLLATWAVHDLNHVGQVVRVMSRRYVDEVGPWKQYLGILNRQ